MFGLFEGTKKAAALESGGFDFEATSITGPLAAEYGHGNQLALCSLHFDCEGMQDWVFERMSSAVGLELNDGDDGDEATVAGGGSGLSLPVFRRKPGSIRGLKVYTSQCCDY
ncbi:hypothetical protein GQ600_25752 [Phytophthora cactorum]|nr:hypothetical protein GQ600_25752 [Phytophthora cactorum]